MPNFVYNIALGRVAELYNNADAGTPSTARLVVAILTNTGLETLETLRDRDTFADIIGGPSDEVTNTGYTRKVIPLADTNVFLPDDTNNQVLLDIATDPTWPSVGAGTNWAALVICYDATSNGVTAAAMIPLTNHDFVVTPDRATVPLAA